MGCSESLPAVESFEEALPMHIPMLRDETNADIEQKLVVRAKLFSSGPYEIKTPEGYLFGNGLHCESLAAHNQLILLDGDDNPIAVCQRKLEGIRQVFQIYTTRRIHSGQTKAPHVTYNRQELCKYAAVNRRPCSNQLRVTFEGESKLAFILGQGTDPTTKVISYRGRLAALTKDNRWDGSWNSYALTVRPGIDPCLMLCLCAIDDEVEGC